MLENLRKPLSEQQVSEYFKRIGLPCERKAPTTDFLDTVIRAQLRTVPFDDADVWASNGVTVPSLETDELFDKIITRRRGGYCFELNILFWRFLQALGFDSYIVIIHLGRLETGSEITIPAHCGIIVNIDGKQRFVDVGYGGDVPDGSLPMNGEEKYGFVQYENGQYTVVGSVEKDGTRVNRFTFKNTPCDPAEIAPLNVYVARRDGSTFAADLKLNIRADNGYAVLGAQRFKYKNGDEILEKVLETQEEARETALKYFGIPDLPTREF